MDDFRALLRSAQQYCPPGPVLFSTLGLALRRVDPAYSPQEFGQEKLSHLLREVEDVGQILEGDRFLFAGAPGVGAETEGPLLRSDVWRAVTEFRPEAPWHLDLADFRVRSTATDAPLLADEPHRFLVLPHADFAYQRQLALDFVAQRRPDLSTELDRLSQDGFGNVHKLFAREGLADDWRTFRTRNIVRWVVEWANKHDVPIDRLRTGSPRAPTKLPPRIIPFEARANHVDIRAVIHAAVDMMSPSELAALPIPPVYLAIAAAQTRR